MDPNNEAFFIGRPVTSLQTMLRVVAMQDQSLPIVIPDGIYGPQTVRAVTALQRREGLPCTGITDEATWNAIRSCYAAAKVEMSPAAPLEIEIPPHQVILEGSDNLHVLLIQAMLHNLHQVYANIPDCSQTGVCDGITVEAVKALQHCCGMTESGILDKRLWQLLTGLYRQAIGSGDRKTVCGKKEKELASTRNLWHNTLL